MGVRADLEKLLKPLLPKRWKLVPYQTNLDVIDAVTVMFKLKTIERLPEAPIGNHLVTFTVTVIEPRDAGPEAENAVDDDLDDLVGALDRIPDVRRATATRVSWTNNNPAYDVEIDVITEQKKAS